MRRDTLVLIALFAAALLTTGGLALVYWKRSVNAQRFVPLLHAAEEAYDIPRDLLARVAYQESHFLSEIIDGSRVSPAGAVGIMQIVPKYHPDVDPRDPYASINYAAKYLRQLYDQFHSWKLALAAYNWGPSNLARNLNSLANWPQETLDYVRAIVKDVPVV